MSGKPVKLCLGLGLETSIIYLIGLANFQACEQLNSWFGGFESILKQMKIENFDWFLHTMLFLLEL